MKVVLIGVILFLFPGSGSAVTLRQPSKTELEPLVNKINKIELLANGARQDLKTIQITEIQIGLRDKEGNWLRPPEPPHSSDTQAARDRYLGKLKLYAEAQKQAQANFKKLHGAQMDAYAMATKRYQRAQEDVHQFRQEAIRLAQTAYGIAPRLLSGAIKSGSPSVKSPDYLDSYIGQTASWSPAHRGSMQKGRWGLTDPDGHVSIGPDAFEYVGKLGLALYHEAQHFERLLTPNQDMRNEPAEEVRVREAEKKHLKSVFELEPKDIEDHEKMLVEMQKRAKIWDTQIRQGLDPYKRGDRASFPGAGHGSWLEKDPDISRELEEIKRGTAELRENARKAADEYHLADLQHLALSACDSGPIDQSRLDLIERRPDPAIYCLDPSAISVDAPCRQLAYLDMLDQLCRGPRLDAAGLNERVRTLYGGSAQAPIEEARPTPAPPGTMEATPPPNATGELASLASKACSNPGSVNQDDVKRLSWFPDPRIAFTEGVGGSLGGCSRDLFFRFVGFSRTWEPGTRLNPDWVNEFARRWAQERRPAPGPAEPAGGDDRPERDRGGRKDPCYDEPGVGRVCPTR